MVGWIVSISVGLLSFGLTSDVFIVSQLKGLYLSVFVLAILWPALLLYQIIHTSGGISAIAATAKRTMQDEGLLIVGISWAFSGLLEGLAGFGLPIAIAAPILVGLGVQPVLAVAATAIGHSWSVSFGDMGVIFQVLVKLTGIPASELVLPVGFLLGLACLLCGLGAAIVLRQPQTWHKVTFTAVIMGLAQYFLARINLLPVSALGAGFFGIFILFFWGHPSLKGEHVAPEVWGVLGSYGGLTVLLTIFTSLPSIRSFLSQFSLQFYFSAVKTSLGFETTATQQSLAVFLHPGFAISLTALTSYLIYRKLRILPPKSYRRIGVRTWETSAPTSLAVIFMVGMSSLMEHTGMMLLLAQTLSHVAGAAFPFFSPWIGILGAFATGSNNNSNVMFAVLQQNTAQILGLNASVIIAAQTAGGALGSMLAPAKLILGCTTAGIPDRQGEILRQTLPFGLGIGLIVGIVTFLFSR
jgi:lactate permease